MDKLRQFVENLVGPLSILKITVGDIIEVLIIAVVVYYVLKWIKTTRAWTLLKGLLMLILFYIIASVFHFDVILWIFTNLLGVSITALIIVFQPELRKALEQLGKRSPISPWFTSKDENVFDDDVVEEIVKATYELAKNRTGALMVIERDDPMDEFEETGIRLDAAITSPLLIQIFEHNTPLHDGAALINGNRITAATCYLPLSDNMNLSKELGTRHRAAVGISEVTDSFTIVVSEETGSVSIAENGELTRRVGREFLYERLKEIQNKPDEQNTTKKKFFRRKG